MAKQIIAEELAEIVAGLLIDSSLFGEFEGTGKHEAFMFDIGQVIADHCGGQVNIVHESMTNPDGTEFAKPMLSVDPDESLPSLTRNVWAYHDPEGWQDYLGHSSPGHSTDEPPVLTEVEIHYKRKALQALIANAAFARGFDPMFKRTMVPWTTQGGSDGELITPDSCHHRLEVRLGNQVILDIYDERGEPATGVLIEINNGVPAFHFDKGGDTWIHMHVVPDGFVVTPGNDDISFDRREPDVYTYDQPGSLIVLCDGHEG